MVGVTPTPQEQSPALAVKPSPAAPGALPAPCTSVFLCPRGKNEKDSSTEISSCLGLRAEPQRFPLPRHLLWLGQASSTTRATHSTGLCGDPGHRLPPRHSVPPAAALRIPTSKGHVNSWSWLPSLGGRERDGKRLFLEQVFPLAAAALQAGGGVRRGNHSPAASALPAGAESPARQRQPASARNKQREESHEL